MSIASQVSRADYVGNGATDEYDYPFLIFANTDLLVTTRDADGVESTLVLTTDYTVDGVGDADGGTITLTGGNLDSGETLTIRRVRPIKQNTDIRNQGEFFPETHEDAFDHFIMVDQQQQDEIDRALKLPETIDDSAFDPTLPADIADHPAHAIVVNEDGDGFDLVSNLAGDPTNPNVTGDLTMLTSGAGITLTSPDGLHTIRLSCDNNGNLAF